VRVDLARLAQGGDVDVTGGRNAAFDLKVAGTTPEHAIEFIDQQRHGFVALIGGDGRVHVGAMDGDMAFGRETFVDGLAWVAFQFHAEANDALLVTKQSLRFLDHELLEGRGEVEVDTGHDYIVWMAIIIHGFGFLSG
jgi:hypothetical protein